MKKYVLLTGLLFGFASAQAQYLQTALAGRVWYSYYQGWFEGTAVYAVGPKLNYQGQLLPSLVLKNQNLITTDTLGVFIEDTVLGTLEIDFLDTNKANVYIDFGRSVGDTFSYPAINGGSINLRLDSMYTYTDFRGISRRVQVIEVEPQAFSYGEIVEFVEGIGPLTSFYWAYPDGSVSDIPGYTLRCVQDGGTKIYGQNISPCYLLNAVEWQLPQVSLYPNPAKNQIFFKGLPPDEHLNAQIFNLQGQMVLNVSRIGKSLNIEKLKANAYYLVLKTAEGKMTTTFFIKE